MYVMGTHLKQLAMVLLMSILWRNKKLELVFAKHYAPNTDRL